MVGDMIINVGTWAMCSGSNSGHRRALSYRQMQYSAEYLWPTGRSLDNRGDSGTTGLRSGENGNYFVVAIKLFVQNLIRRSGH